MRIFQKTLISLALLLATHSVAFGQRIQFFGMNVPQGFKCNETQLTTITCQQHNKADALTLNDGGNVSPWTATVGLPVAVAFTRAPAFKTAILNGNPIVRFDAGTTSDVLQTAAFGAALSQPVTIFLVAKTSTRATGSGQIVHDGIAASHRLSFIYTDTIDDVSTSTLDFSVASTSTAFHIYTVIFNGLTSSLYEDGTSVATGALDVTDTMTGLSLGGALNGGSRLTGDIEEIMIYTGSPSTGDRQHVEACLSLKTAITVAGGTTGCPEGYP